MGLEKRPKALVIHELIILTISSSTCISKMFDKILKPHIFMYFNYPCLYTR